VVVVHALRRQGQEDCQVQGQPGLHSEFLDSKGDTEKSCFEEPNQTTPKRKKKIKVFVDYLVHQISWLCEDFALLFTIMVPGFLKYLFEITFYGKDLGEEVESLSIERGKTTLGSAVSTSRSSEGW